MLAIVSDIYSPAAEAFFKFTESFNKIYIYIFIYFLLVLPFDYSVIDEIRHIAGWTQVSIISHNNFFTVRTSSREYCPN